MDRNRGSLQSGKRYLLMLFLAKSGRMPDVAGDIPNLHIHAVFREESIHG
jgi:hypothetical protein